MDRSLSLLTHSESYSEHVARDEQSDMTASRVGTTSLSLLYLFLSFQLVDQIALPILVATFLLSKSVKRHPTVVNVCVTWIITGIISSLLLYAEKHVGPEPPMMLCVSQAALLNGVPPMNSLAVLTLVYQVNFVIHEPKTQVKRSRIYALLLVPYVAFFCFSTIAALFAIRKPHAVNRNRRFFYCSFESPISNAFAIFTALVLLTSVGYAVATGLFLTKNWRLLRQPGSLDLHFLGRVALFVLLVFVGLILSVLSIVAPKSPIPDLFTASTGPWLFLFLGTQPNIYRAWLGRPNPAPPRIIDELANLDLERSNSGEILVLEPALPAEKHGGRNYVVTKREDRVVDMRQRQGSVTTVARP